MVMKKFVLIAAALTLSLASFAQENGTDRRQRGGRPERPDEATMIKMRTERAPEVPAVPEGDPEWAVLQRRAIRTRVSVRN